MLFIKKIGQENICPTFQHSPYIMDSPHSSITDNANVIQLIKLF